MSRPGQSDVESGALLDTTGRPVSGGEVAVGIVDEMPEASELGPLPQQEEADKATKAVPATPVTITTPNATEESASNSTSASRRPEESNNLSSLATNQKPNV